MRQLSLASKHFPLGDAETVLLIRDDERQIVIDDLLLDQGMRADDDIRFVRSNLFVGKPFFLCRQDPVMSTTSFSTPCAANNSATDS